MTRLKQAWLALCGNLEPEVREVVREVPVPLDGPQVCSLYVVYVPDHKGGSMTMGSGRIVWMKNLPLYYTSCELAHNAHPGETVKRVKAILSGGQHYLAGELEEVIPQSKPKVAKGKRRNG